GDDYACLNQGTQPGPYFRYKFKGFITDTTTTAPLTPTADKVTDNPCSKLFHLNSMGSFTDLTLNAVYDIKMPTNSTTDIAQAVYKGTPPSSQLTITESPKNQQEAHSTQAKSAKRILFNQESTDPKKQKKD
ncbi:hypothetical protein Tco_1579598, partial [Tanacetum coccineum]